MNRTLHPAAVRNMNHCPIANEGRVECREPIILHRGQRAKMLSGHCPSDSTKPDRLETVTLPASCMVDSSEENRPFTNTSVFQSSTQGQPRAASLRTAFQPRSARRTQPAPQARHSCTSTLHSLASRSETQAARNCRNPSFSGRAATQGRNPRNSRTARRIGRILSMLVSFLPKSLVFSSRFSKIARRPPPLP